MSFGATSFGSSSFGSGPNQGAGGGGPPTLNVSLTMTAADAVASTSVVNAVSAALTQTSTATYSLATVNKVGASLSVLNVNTWSGTSTVQSGASLNSTTANTWTLTASNAINVGLTKTVTDATLVCSVSFGLGLPDRAVSFNFVCDNAVMVTTVTNLGGQRFPEPPQVVRFPYIIRYHGNRS